MKAAYTLEGAKRTDAGKGAARALRREGRIPAILYGTKAKENTSFSLNEKDLTLAYKKGAFTNKLVELSIDGAKNFALPREVQTHPVTDRIEHADFLLVDKTSEVKVKVPVRVLGAERCVGVRRGGTLNVVRHEIEFFCTPESIPSRIDVDVRNINIGSSVHISAISLPEGVRPTIDRDFTVITVTGRGSKDDADTASETAEGADAEKKEGEEKK